MANETGAIRHPLDPLTAGEVEETTRILSCTGYLAYLFGKSHSKSNKACLH